MNRYQTRIAAIICVFGAFAIGGCAPTSRIKKSDTDAKRETNEVASAAEEAGRGYAGRLSAACRDTAARAPDMKSWAGVYDSFHDASSKARTDSFAAFEDAITARLKGGETPYDPAAVTQVFSDAADGFERASKTMQGSGK